MSAVGQSTPFTSASEFNALQFQIAQALAKMQTATLVQVMGCTNNGALSPVGTVDIRVLVNLMSGNRTSIPHGTIFKVPYLRVQGGANAVILDPVVGDIGLCVFASRDISSVVAAKGTANPGSQRVFDWADALYVGGMLNAVPTQYVRFSASGIEVVSPTNVTIRAPVVDIGGDSGTVINIGAASGTVTTIDGVAYLLHTHSGVQTGSGISGPVVP
jgi:hypothetical protein